MHAARAPHEDEARPGSRALDRRAVVILGCPLSWDRHGALAGSAGRRARAGFEVASSGGGDPVIASGGRVWGGVVEADAIRDELARLGLTSARVVRERCSHTTRDNARFTAEILARAGIGRVLLVTSDWHLPRAAAHFRRVGLQVDLAPAQSLPAPWTSRLGWWARERLAACADAIALRRRGP